MAHTHASPLVRFFQWNDIHVADPAVAGRRRVHAGAIERARWASECARGMHGVNGADFILSAGDLIDGDCPDYDADFAMLKREVLAPAGVPYFPCAGNHENRAGEGDPDANAAYHRACGRGTLNYTFIAAGILFVVLDSSGSDKGPDERTALRAARLRKALASNPRYPAIIATHVPVLPVREPGVLEKSFNYPGWVNRDASLLEAVKEQHDRIIAILSGHVHITGAVRCPRHGVYQIVTAGLAGYPADFAAYEVFADRIDVTMHRPPAHLLPETTPRASLHGRPRHAIDFTDSNHPDHDRYLWGNANERRFSIALVGARRPHEAARFTHADPTSID